LHWHCQLRENFSGLIFEEINMNILKRSALSFRWLMALLVLSTLTGCPGSSINGNTNVIVTESAPTVNSVLPANTATGVPLNSSVSATFSKALNPLTIDATTFVLTQGTIPVTGTVTYSGKVAIFKPNPSFVSGLLYTATVTKGVKDLLGNAFASDYTWSFTTGPADLIPPVVISVTPADLSTTVTLNSNINATFSKPMDPLTITSSTFTLVNGATSVSGSVTFTGSTASFHPSSNLLANTLYTATITPGARDMQEIALGSAYPWTFTTGSTLAAGPASVNLGTAGSFALLSKTGVTNTGATAVTGDVGVSPAAATYLTGFDLIADSSNEFSTSSFVTGRLYAANYAVPTPAKMTTAISDMMIAYADAAGRTLPDYTELGAGDVSGMTLAPGLYKWGTGLLINTDVTLSGSATDVWIFQIAGDLTLANATSVLLSGGALPKNIFWQVGGGVGVALNTTSHFEGVLLATKAITLTTGASVRGRLLAQTAVTLQGNAITQPAP
jgi:hypothetical protein